jgi:hypothetical protein
MELAGAAVAWATHRWGVTRSSSRRLLARASEPRWLGGDGCGERAARWRRLLRTGNAVEAAAAGRCRGAGERRIRAQSGEDRQHGGGVAQ